MPRSVVAMTEIRRTPTGEVRSEERVSERGTEVPKGGARGRGWLFVVMVAALVGTIFAGISTSDNLKNHDGETHQISCSINPLAAKTDAESGCSQAMFSPYSSLFRVAVWGGVPIALFAFATFAFLAAFALSLGVKRDVSRRDTLFLLLGSLVPVGASAVYATIAATQLGSFCQVCIGIYVASGLTALLALIAHMRAWPGEGKLPWGRWGLWFLEGVVVVAAVLGLYMAWVPSDRESVTKGCGALVEEPGNESFVLTLPSEPGAVPSLEVLDPLCNWCKGLDQRLAASGLDKKLARRVVVFPMDTCVPNDMVRSRLHPGACTVSYAMLCAPQSAKKILDYAFADQERLLELGKTNEAALKADLEQHFPEVKGCIGSAKVKAELTRARNWAARNALELSTPQLFVAGTQVCKKNTDLGLEYTLTRMLEKAGVQP
ncbi:MAG: vitamin K epoxide reductase family protein [Myxococcota bacterium]